jgi:undecaprenyl-diphosphatase
MTTVSALGGTAGMAVLTVRAAGALWWRGRPRDAAVVVAAFVGAELLVVGFKDLWARARPPEALHLVPVSDYSMPSGHSVESVAVLGMLAVVIWRSTGSGRLRATGVAVTLVPIAVIGLSRLYLGVHWFTDVLAGWLLGAAWLALCTGLLSSAPSRTDHKASTSPPGSAA